MISTLVYGSFHLLRRRIIASGGKRIIRGQIVVLSASRFSNIVFPHSPSVGTPMRRRIAFRPRVCLVVESVLTVKILDLSLCLKEDALTKLVLLFSERCCFSTSVSSAFQLISSLGS